MHIYVVKNNWLGSLRVAFNSMDKARAELKKICETDEGNKYDYELTENGLEIWGDGGKVLFEIEEVWYETDPN